jgi:kynurenine formamidase
MQIGGGNPYMRNRRFLDLSIAIERDLPSDPAMMIPKIQYLDHEQGADSMKLFFPGLQNEHLPGGKGWAVEHVELSTHSGTHLDAPWHYHPTMDKGRKALTIDEVPLEWCMGNGAVLDFRGFEDGYKVTAKDMETAFRRIGYTLKEGDIVLVMTGADRFWGTPEYMLKGCGMGREATLWLLDQGIRVVGTDAWSWDRPLPLIAEEFRRTGNTSIVWEGHFAGIEKGYCHIEKLTNLDKLPSFGFTVFCFPIKIKNASAGWIRAVAMLEEEIG